MANSISFVLLQIFTTKTLNIYRKPLDGGSTVFIQRNVRIRIEKKSLIYTFNLG